MRYLLGALLLTVATLSSIGCQDDADVASYNLSKSADNFGIMRRVVFYNGITGEYMLTVEGALNITHSGDQLEVVVKTGEDAYKKHFLGLSDNVTYFCEQIESKNVSVHHYKVVFKPSVIIPDIEIK